MDSTDRQLTIDEVVEKDIFSLLGIESIPPEEKERLTEKILETVRLRVFDRFDQSLSEDERAQLKTLLDSGSDEEIKHFYEEKEFDFNKAMIEEALKYKIEVAAYADFIKQSGATLAELKEKINKGDL